MIDRRLDININKIYLISCKLQKREGELKEERVVRKKERECV